MEFGETPEATLRRELVEETGLAPTAYMLRDVWANLIVDTRPEHLGEQTHHVGVIYTVTLEDRAPKSGPDGEDSLEARWVKVAELEERNCTPFLWRAVGMGAGEG
jgi:8-oxo-dGTP pyrophosphatase MutT (NUDIX family)